MAMKDDEDVVILDVRSNYEHNLGKFKNAVTLDIENFRDFPEKINELAKYKDKKIPDSIAPAALNAKKHLHYYCTRALKMFTNCMAVL